MNDLHPTQIAANFFNLNQTLAQATTAANARLAEIDALKAELARYKRLEADLRGRIETVLDLIDGREDVVDNSEGTAADTPNLEMRIGMALRGEDRP
jgi:hypothetical protein